MFGTRLKIDFECQIPIEFSTWPKKGDLEYPSGTRVGLLGQNTEIKQWEEIFFADLHCGTESNTAASARIPAYPECIA